MSEDHSALDPGVLSPAEPGLQIENANKATAVHENRENEFHNGGPGLSTVPSELRLQIYGHLLPLRVRSGSLKGLVLSCRTIKEEVYHEMKKESRTLHDKAQKRWPFNENFEIVFPGRLFSDEVVINVPYLPGHQIAEKMHLCRALFSFPDVKLITLRVSDFDDDLVLAYQDTLLDHDWFGPEDLFAEVQDSEFVEHVGMRKVTSYLARGGAHKITMWETPFASEGSGSYGMSSCQRSMEQLGE